MAKKKRTPPKKAASPKKPGATRPSAAAGKSSAAAGALESPPSGPVDLIDNFRDLIEQSRRHGTAQNFQLVADAAAEMERRFAEVRRQAEASVKGVNASTQLFGESAEAVADALLPKPIPAERAPEHLLAAEVHGLRPLFLESAKVSALLPGAGANGGGDQQFQLENFFAEVVSSVIDAQKELDKQSLEYARSRARSAIPATLYAIPRVQAEIKAGFTTTTGKGFNIIIVKDETQSQSFGETTIQFDVVGSPPSPGPPDQFTQPIPEFLIAGDPLKTDLLKASGLTSDLQAVALILRLTRVRPNPQTYFVLAPTAAGNQFQTVTVSETAQVGQYQADPMQPVPAAGGAADVFAVLQKVYQTIVDWLKSVSG